MGAVGFSAISGSTMVWQVYVDAFDHDFWDKLAEGNDFELYTQELDRYW